MFDPLRPVVLVLALALAGSGAPAQQVQLPAAAVTIVQAQAAGPAMQLNVPQPPKALDPGPPKSFPMVPQGVGGKPLPESPPTSTPVPIGGVNPTAPCDFRFFMNNQVSPAGASQSASTLEPNVAISRDTVIYTGNFFAARSLDSGMSWTHTSPYTRFPARDAGFCCDQRTVYVPSVDMTFWLLEYRYSATTQTGGLRVAFTRGRGDFRNDVWNYFDVTPATFGQPAGSFLDFSDIAYGSTNLYGSAIIARGSDNTALGLVAWRANLLDIFDLGGIGIGYYTTAQLGGFGSYRFAQGAANTMYWAAHTSTTNLRVYSWGESAPAATLVDRTVAAWSGTPTAAAGPDGRDWTGFGYTVNTVLSGYANAGEMGFLWTSGAVAGRPQCFVRVARLRTSDVGLIAQHDIWSNTIAFHFPTCATNAAGDVGGTFMYGGGGFYPSTAAFVIDPCAPNWAPLPSFAFAAGARGPSSNRSGDYLGAGRHSGVPMTFVGSGFALDAGGNVVPRYVWFGREQNTPGWVDAAVSATDNTNTVPLFAAITVTHTDRFGSNNGSTPFSRSYPPRQAFQVTAPQFAVSGGSAQHLFNHWVYQGNVQPTGARTLSVDDLGTGPRTITARAVYLPLRALTIDSTPASGVAITVAPTDVYNNGDGVTPFQRAYLPFSTVSLTAPTVVGNNAFRYWIINGVPGAVNQNSIGVSVTVDTTAVADYGTVIGMGTNWRDITAASPTRPSGRYDHAMAYQGASGKVLLFGGSGPAETWELDGDQWTLLTPTTSPSARSQSAMAYDTVNARTLLFGGFNGIARLGDTWAWDGTDWTQLIPTTSPAPRREPAMAYDSANSVILLFGGNVTGGFFGLQTNETWSFDGTTWTQLAPATTPPAITSPSMAYDARRQRTVLCGTNANLASFETWEWDGTDWLQMAPANQPQNRASSLAYDSLRGKVVLFSGRRIPSPLRDTWEWNGIDWTQRFTADAPVFRGQHAMVYDEQRHRCVVFGGFTQPFTSRDDTWEYYFACEIIGEGITGGGALPITCTTAPQIGQNFCLEFPNTQLVGVLVIGLSPPLYPALPLDPPTFCVPSNLYALPDITLPVDTDPANVCIPIPADPALIGGLFTMQGVVLDAAVCLTVTDGLAVVVQG